MKWRMLGILPCSARSFEWGEEDDDDDDGCVENFGWYIDSISTKQELE